MQTAHYPSYTCHFRKGEPLAFQVDMEGNILKQIPATAKRTVSDFNGEVFSYKNGNGFDFFHTSIDTLFVYDPVGNRLLPEFTMTFPNPEEKPIHLYYRLPNHFMVNYYFWGKNGPENSGDILIDKKEECFLPFPSGKRLLRKPPPSPEQATISTRDILSGIWNRDN